MKEQRFPTSVTNTAINCIGLLSFLGGIAVLINHPQASSTVSIFFLMLCWLVPILILEALFLRPISLTMIARTKPPQLKLALLRCVGLILTLCPFALGYWAFPEYRDSFYQPWWAFLQLTLPFILALSLPYFLWCSKQDNTSDAYLQLGLLCFGQTQQLDQKLITQHMLGWLVKAFFLPLMLGYFWGSIQNIEQINMHTLLDSLFFCIQQLLHPSTINHTVHYLSNNFSYVFDFAWAIIFLIDVGIVCVGYAITLRLFDNQIRSTEPTLLGWAVALVCYAPFNTLFSGSYMSYTRGDFTWGTWLAPHDIWYVIWGSIILLLCLIYVAASIAFGLRFSNLTNRGIITNGPYRYVKHPAYLAKNLSWWFVAIPFVAHDQQYGTAIRCILMLLVMNFIYYLRAKTEERHLSHDPVYLDYLQAIKTHGLAAQCKRTLKTSWQWLRPAKI